MASRPKAFIDRSVRWLAETFHLAEGRRVLDLGCGPGLYANALAGLGAHVVGVDFSSHALAHARKVASATGVEVEYREGNYLNMDLGGPFDLALLIFGDFCPLSPGQRRALLSKLSSALEPNGKFVFDVTSLSHFGSVQEASGYEWVPEGGFWSPDPHFLFSNRFTYPEASAYLDRFGIVEAEERREIFNWIQCFSRETLERELRENGWRVQAYLGNLAGDAFDPQGAFFGVVAHPD